VAFNVARHLAFVAAVNATSMAGFDYIPPSYHAMQTKHIEPKVKQVKAEIEKATKQSIALYGATICSDGWDNVIHRPLSVMMDFGNSMKILNTWLNQSLRLCESSTNTHPQWPRHGWR
jgi:hypothetical protein